MSANCSTRAELIRYSLTRVSQWTRKYFFFESNNKGSCNTIKISTFAWFDAQEITCIPFLSSNLHYRNLAIDWLLCLAQPCYRAYALCDCCIALPLCNYCYYNRYRDNRLCGLFQSSKKSLVCFPELTLINRAYAHPCKSFEHLLWCYWQTLQTSAIIICLPIKNWSVFYFIFVSLSLFFAVEELASCDSLLVVSSSANKARKLPRLCDCLQSMPW